MAVRLNSWAWLSYDHRQGGYCYKPSKCLRKSILWKFWNVEVWRLLPHPKHQHSNIREEICRKNIRAYGFCVSKTAHLQGDRATNKTKTKCVSIDYTIDPRWPLASPNHLSTTSQQQSCPKVTACTVATSWPLHWNVHYNVIWEMDSILSI
jgi:hypothetical protein